MVDSVEEALAVRETASPRSAWGRSVATRAPGFDFGNSPFLISDVDFTAKVIAQRTGAGTQGIVAARQAACLYAASLVTARATAHALLAHATERITLVAMGNNAVARTAKTNCARCICAICWKADPATARRCGR